LDRDQKLKLASTIIGLFIALVIGYFFLVPYLDKLPKSKLDSSQVLERPVDYDSIFLRILDDTTSILRVKLDSLINNSVKKKVDEIKNIKKK